ncbi:alpha-galactosidase [Medicago truncatula]|uniref:Alpha-galactosidase n=1 Tax=Medicago truncatula TaxID=3880 RepID=G7IHM6_MEDTR|nr:alpha-galactosidase [Medicago truncatula]
MGCFITLCLVSFWLLFGSCCFQSVSSRNLSESDLQQAALPPRGWNSYDSFSWIISEEEFLQNAEIVSQRLHAHGYEFVVVDFLWYRKKVAGANVDSRGFDVIDEWGRMVPDPGRWPSSHGGNGLSEVAKKVHSLGLKFGIHIMRGISTQAVDANTPILDTSKGGAYQESGRVWHAKDIAIPKRACGWMQNGFMSVDTTLGAGRAFLRSLYEQYAAWGVDLVKHDCVFGENFDLNEITYVSEVLSQFNRPIVYSLSPGKDVTPAMAKDVSGLVNMYRITGDDFDKWDDVKAHFDISRDLATANMIGAKGLKGSSWPDLDMLPFGWLTDKDSKEEPHRYSNLNLDEKRTQMTLWALAKSPLMYGGDMRKIDPATYEIITNPTVLEINYFSSNNMEFPYVTSSKNSNNEYQHHIRKMRRSKKGKKPIHSLGLTSCTESKASGWTIENINQDLERICWKGSAENKHQNPFCVHKRELQFRLDKESKYQEDYRGKHQLVATNQMRLCFDASPKRKVTSKEFKRGAFSPCSLDSNQIWELNSNGTLVNSYSGLCATVKYIQANVESGGIRSWIATGRKGEVYMAFFNLNEQKTPIYANMSYLAKVLPGRRINSCQGKEVWSGKNVVTTQGTISMDVEVHGCALVVLYCN